MGKFFDKKQYAQLLSNGSPENIDQDHFPVVKLFLPDENATWLLTHIDPEDHAKAFGLSDWGNGHVETGPINLELLENIEGKYGFEVTRDAQFQGKFPLSVYAYAAQQQEGIVDRRASTYDITENEAHLKELYLRKYRGKGAGLGLG